MSNRISRHTLATCVVDRLAAGDEGVVKQLAAYIVDERLTRELDLIISEIEYECATRGQLVADVTSAYALDETLRSELKQFIADETGARSVDIREKIDTELIGGVVIETPGKYFDGSLASQLNQLKVNA